MWLHHVTGSNDWFIPWRFCDAEFNNLIMVLSHHCFIYSIIGLKLHCFILSSDFILSSYSYSKYFSHLPHLILWSLLHPFLSPSSPPSPTLLFALKRFTFTFSFVLFHLILSSLHFAFISIFEVWFFLCHLCSVLFCSPLFLCSWCCYKYSLHG